MEIWNSEEVEEAEYRVDLKHRIRKLGSVFFEEIRNLTTEQLERICDNLERSRGAILSDFPKGLKDTKQIQNKLRKLLQKDESETRPAVPHNFVVLKDDNVMCIEGKRDKSKQLLMPFYNEKDARIKFNILEKMSKVNTKSALFDKQFLLDILDFLNETEKACSVRITVADDSAMYLETENWVVMLACRQFFKSYEEGGLDYEYQT